ncbi:SCO4225 family membrane protein [Streptomyces sp. P9-A2]|uniref:SCO4225 family membrane protein n=1 Tax=Streptomyces sp. P9-A2 TaxID=3072284 RepID=UPI002FC81F40
MSKRIVLASPDRTRPASVSDRSTHSRSAPMTGAAADSRPSLPRRLRDRVGLAALAYLALCAAVLVWAVVATVTDDSGESMALVLPLLVTAPCSLVVSVLPEHGSMFLASLVFGAAVNAAVISWCTSVLRRGRPDPES